jgi:radical SAM protein with 4Fe4S-binding SPASM domain
VEAIGATSVDFSPVRRWTPEVEEDLWIRDSKSLQSLEREIAELIRLKRAGAPIETSEEKLGAFVDHFEDREGSLAVSPCRVGMREYHIRPNGDVKVCWYHPAIGNVRRGDARSIWHGEKAREVRLNTVQCELFKVHSCAHSCLGHQPIRKLVARTWMLMRHSGRGAARDARKEG